MFIGFSVIESNFLEETAPYEARFKELAQKFASVSGSGQSNINADIFNNPRNYKPLICYNKPARNNRIVARIHYKMPESRRPKSPDEANPLIRLTVTSERIFKSQGSSKEEFPIYDILIHYIDTKTGEVILTQTVEGDPEDYHDGNRISPGTVPISQAEEKISEIMRYEPNFAWHFSH